MLLEGQQYLNQVKKNLRALFFMFSEAVFSMSPNMSMTEYVHIGITQASAYKTEGTHRHVRTISGMPIILSDKLCKCHSYKPKRELDV